MRRRRGEWKRSAPAGGAHADGDSKNEYRRPRARGAVGDPPLPLDGRAAGDDHLLLDAALQPARSPTTSPSSASRTTLISSATRISSRRFTTPCCWSASVLVISVIGGLFVALLIDQPSSAGHRAADGHRALLRHADGERAGVEEPADEPDLRSVRLVAQSVGLPPSIWFTNWPLLSVIIIVSWQWLPFAALILLTALQSLDEEQKEAAALDGAGPVSYFFYIILPHIARAITVVILIETIFLLSVFAEILRHHQRRPGHRDHQHRLPRLQAGAARFRRRRRLGRRHRRRRARQHRRDLPDAHRSARIWRPEPWRDEQSIGRRIGVTVLGVGGRPADLLPDPVDGPDQLQVRARRLRHPAEVPVLPLDARELRRGAAALELSPCAYNSIVLSIGANVVGLLIAVPAAWSMAFAPIVHRARATPASSTRSSSPAYAAAGPDPWLTSATRC